MRDFEKKAYFHFQSTKYFTNYYLVSHFSFSLKEGIVFLYEKKVLVPRQLRDDRKKQKKNVHSFMIFLEVTFMP